jgi:hypothetical protein
MDLSPTEAHVSRMSQLGEELTCGIAMQRYTMIRWLVTGDAGHGDSAFTHCSTDIDINMPLPTA